MLLSEINKENLTREDVNTILFDIPKDDGLNGDWH